MTNYIEDAFTSKLKSEVVNALDGYTSASLGLVFALDWTEKGLIGRVYDDESDQLMKEFLINIDWSE